MTEISAIILLVSGIIIGIAIMMIFYFQEYRYFKKSRNYYYKKFCEQQLIIQNYEKAKKANKMSS